MKANSLTLPGSPRSPIFELPASLVSRQPRPPPSSSPPHPITPFPPQLLPSSKISASLTLIPAHPSSPISSRNIASRPPYTNTVSFSPRQTPNVSCSSRRNRARSSPRRRKGGSIPRLCRGSWGGVARRGSRILRGVLCPGHSSMLYKLTGLFIRNSIHARTMTFSDIVHYTQSSNDSIRKCHGSFTKYNLFIPVSDSNITPFLSRILLSRTSVLACLLTKHSIPPALYVQNSLARIMLVSKKMALHSR